MTATSGSSDSINTYFIQKALACHPNFRKCTLTVEYITVLRVATLIFGENKMAGRSTISIHKNEWLQVDYLCQDGFNSENLPNGFVMQHQILINVIIFVAYVLNLPLNTQRSHSRSQRAGNGAWFWLMTDARYIALPLISRYHCLDPTNRDISGLHCITFYVSF